MIIAYILDHLIKKTSKTGQLLHSKRQGFYDFLLRFKYDKMKEVY